MKPPKNQNPPKRSRSLKHAVAILCGMGIKCTESTLLAVADAHPNICDDHYRFDIADTVIALQDVPPPPEGVELEPKEILERRKLKAQYLKEEFRLAVEQRKFLPIEEVQRDLIRIGAAMRSELQRFIGDLPNWEGVPAAEMSIRGSKWLREICANLHDETSKLYA